MDDYTPEVDTSYGLIYRLNYLWARADGEALNGRLDQWELVLDRIMSNLLYRKEAKIEVDKKGKVTSVDISDSTIEAWQKLKSKIKEAKKEMHEALIRKKRTKYLISKENYYQAVMTYDIWLRKFMQSLKLYMKESKEHPSGALFGKRFGKK